MLGSGYEGVREIQKRLTNTMGWSATSGTVDNWVYDEANKCASCPKAPAIAQFHASVLTHQGLAPSNACLPAASDVVGHLRASHPRYATLRCH